MYQGCTTPSANVVPIGRICPDRECPLPRVVPTAVASETTNDLRSAAHAPVVLLDSDALAARLGLAERFVRRLVEERRTPYFKIGRLVRDDPEVVDRWVQARAARRGRAAGASGAAALTPFAVPVASSVDGGRRG
jgi:excisionase family DNA binding protein